MQSSGKSKQQEIAEAGPPQPPHLGGTFYYNPDTNQPQPFSHTLPPPPPTNGESPRERG